MNSVQTVTLKQCTVTKLGCVHSAHTQKPSRVHTARAVPRSWALLRAQQAGRAHVMRTASAGRALAGRALVATGPGSLPQVATQNPGRDTQFQQARSRPQIDVATSLFCSHRNALIATQNLGRDIKSQQGSQNHVATSNRCRDTTQATPGRDLKTGSRHRFSSPAPSQVATPNQVATLLETNLCRDINFT